MNISRFLKLICLDRESMKIENLSIIFWLGKWNEIMALEMKWNEVMFISETINSENEVLSRSCKFFLTEYLNLCFCVSV